MRGRGGVPQTGGGGPEPVGIAGPRADQLGRPVADRHFRGRGIADAYQEDGWVPFCLMQRDLQQLVRCWWAAGALHQGGW